MSMLGFPCWYLAAPNTGVTVLVDALQKAAVILEKILYPERC